MKTSLQNIKSKISQGGSLMVEALAMLALISLVTPTLYKKSAERTTELQDINTATHVRTVLKAIDNYVKVNYQNLIAPDGALSADGKVAKIDDLTTDEYKAYFPYGYEFENLKNFGKPKAALRRQGDSVTAFVEFPSSLDLGEVRAARIASIVGSNGGYVNASKEALGVGGVWNLTDSDLTDLGFTTDKSSIVAASSEAINSATTSALENEKYLQRTKVESEDQLWRNTMTTNLYMGNPKGDEAGERYKILGVDQMIVGSINYHDTPESLVLTDQAEGGGSAWMAGTLHALSDTFRLDDDYENGRYSMEFGREDSTTIKALTDESVSFNNGQVVFNNVGDDEERPGATFYVDTEIDKRLDVFGDTSVATNADAVFKAGTDGSYITADSSSVDLLGGNITTTRTGEGDSTTRNTTIDTDLQVNGKTKMGTGDEKPTRENWDMRLNVQGNAFVSDILEAGEIDTKNFKTLELHAGGTDYDQETWWLNATRDGVTVADPDTGALRFSAGQGETSLYAPTGNTDQDSALILDAESELRSQGLLSLYTTDETQSVSVQEGAFVVGGHGENADVDINAANTLVNGGTFNVHDGGYNEVGQSSLYVDPKHVNVQESGTGLVQMNANVTRVAPRDNGVFEVVENSTGEDNWENTSGAKVLRVSAENFPNTAAMAERGAAELDLTRFRLWDNGTPEGEKQSILTVQLDANSTGAQDMHNREDSQSSIYIRRGAIEIEPTSGTAARADSNWGYIEASRFVANNPPHNATEGDTTEYIKPTFSADYTAQNLGYNQSPDTEYDRYMVNPAYTSVMHDIKLTTRGGARLSDILPDFINKGIYVVNNSYQEMASTGTFGSGITIFSNGGRLEIQGLKDIGSSEGERWASPFLGVVPAPQCPPGHTRVVTITPANFLMAQAGQLTTTTVSARTGKQLSVDDTDYYNRLADSGYKPGDKTITGAQLQTKSLSSGNDIYYLGWGQKSDFEIDGKSYAPQPLYFQQSTWLKSAVLPYTIGGSAPCNSTLGSDNGCSSGFAGWVAVMGFVYPGAWYNKIIETISGMKADANDYYWNVFPVLGNTLEAYATVYCYFDRNNISAQSFTDSTMVDTDYDQLRKFRSDNKKNEGYADRLDDPTLKYKNPW